MRKPIPLKAVTHAPTQAEIERFIKAADGAVVPEPAAIYKTKSVRFTFDEYETLMRLATLWDCSAQKAIIKAIRLADYDTKVIPK